MEFMQGLRYDERLGLPDCRPITSRNQGTRTGLRRKLLCHRTFQMTLRGLS
jgi:hypothetical protein